MAQEQAAKPVLSTSVTDVRHFVALLRGVNFVNRATVMVSKNGICVMVEEARTLQAKMYIFSDKFDEYTFNPEPPNHEPSQRSDDETEEKEEEALFEIPLNTLIECLNIFGTAGPATSSSTHSNFKKWRRADDESGDEDDRGRGATNGTGRIEQYFGGTEKRTGMRMSYAGAGYPLTLLIAEDCTGPTTACEIATFDFEPYSDMTFERSEMVLQIILKSAWLKEALSELDPSCDKLTFIGNPPSRPGKAPRNLSAKPMLRIHAVGTFGSAEMDYPNDREVLETFECQETVSFTYRFAHVSRSLRALQSSTKTSLRIQKDGLMSLQFLVPAPKSGESVIEFLCMALDDE